MNTETENVNEEGRVDDTALVTLDRSPSADNYYDTDNRRSQKYEGILALSWLVTVDGRGLPKYDNHARRIWSKHKYMLNSVATMARKMYRMNLAGNGHPAEAGLDERANGVELPGEAPEKIVLSEENPITKGPLSPFEELEELLLSTNVKANTRDSSEEDDVHKFTLIAQLTAKMERPSMIPEKEELKNQLLKFGPNLLAPLNSSMARALVLARERRRIQKHQTLATNVAQNWADHFAKEAREETNYKERMDALHDEVERAALQTAEEMFDDHTDEEIAEELEVPVEVIQTCKDHWKEYLHVGSGLSPARERISPQKVK